MARAETEPVVLCERRERVAVLTLNRPARLNAWTRELEERYFSLLADADRDPAIRAIVVTGAGSGFCAGGDIDERTAGDFATAYDRAEAALARASAWPDFAEGVASFIERRPPRFPPLT